MSKPILCLDFDGVVHDYKGGWQGANKVGGGLVPGFIEFMEAVHERFEVHIFSSRSHQEGGIAAMFDWLLIKICDEMEVGDMDLKWAPSWFTEIKWPTEKPPAMITLDDRGLTFTGEWPSLEALLSFRPWNRR